MPTPATSRFAGGGQPIGGDSRPPPSPPQTLEPHAGARRPGRESEASPCEGAQVAEERDSGFVYNMRRQI